MKRFVVVLNSFFILATGENFLSETEWNITLALAKDTFAKNYFMAPRDMNDPVAISMLKNLSKNRIYTAFIKPEILREYLENMDMQTYRWTAVVLKEKQLSSVDYFDNKDIINSYFWIIFDASNGTLRQELQKIYIPMDSATILIEKKNDDVYIISEYYKIKKLAPGVFRKLSEWKNNGFFRYQREHWFDRKSDMQKYEFTTVKFDEDLYLSPKDKVNEAIWKELSVLLNFTVVDKIVKYSFENGSIDFESEEEEALLDTQIYIGGSEKYRYLLGPTSQSGLYMHIKEVGEDAGFTRFIKPFSKYIWISVGLWIFYGGVLMFIFEHLTRKFGGNRKPLRESFLTVFTPLDCVSNQNGSEIGTNVSSRLVLFLIRCSGMFIFYSYSATLISCILLYIPKLPFTDLRGFVDDGTYKIIAEGNSDVDTFFRVSSTSLEQLVYRKYLSDVTKWSRLDKAMNRLCAGEKLVLVAFDDEAEKYKPCNVVKIKHPLKIFANGFKIRFKSPFRGLLHIKLLLMKTTGVLQRVNNRVIDKIYRKPNRTENSEINMRKVVPVFLLLLCGYAASLVILGVEIIFKKVKTKNIQRNAIFYPIK